MPTTVAMVPMSTEQPHLGVSRVGLKAFEDSRSVLCSTDSA
jgi:hypothetical protein